jgi:hypothetical protein
MRTDALGPPDLRIVLGQLLTDTPCGPEGYSLDGAAIRFVSRDLGEWTMRLGSEVLVCPVARAEQRSISLVTRGSALAAIGAQRGWQQWHASSVRPLGARGAVLFAGPSGAGKSTLAAQCVAEGAELLSDDLARIAHDGAPQLHPSAAGLRLDDASWCAVGPIKRTAQATALDASGKRLVLLTGSGSREPIPIAAIVCLAPGGTGPAGLKRLRGARAVAALLRATAYRSELDTLTARHGERARAAMQVAAALAILETPSPRTFSDGERIAAEAMKLTGASNRWPSGPATT